MQLRSIDKSLYQQRYKRVAISLALGLAVLSLSISTLLIAVMGNPQEGSNTALNAAGVLLAGAILIFTLQKLKHRPYFNEVYYVWQLKQELNQIARRMQKIKAAAQQGDQQAMVILSFSYAGSEQLWNLDDNTLVMDELRAWKHELETLKQQYSVEAETHQYRRDLLNNY